MKMYDCTNIFLFIPIPKALVATITGMSLLKTVVELFDVPDNLNLHDIYLLDILNHKSFGLVLNIFLEETYIIVGPELDKMVTAIQSSLIIIKIKVL